jgi:cytoplasmic iron level regulating protein YaaA (DUF328/UPF0246 family)
MDCVKCRELRQVFEFKLDKYIEARSAAYYRVSTELAAHKNVDMERARNDFEEHQLVCGFIGDSYQNLKSDLRPQIHG